jgi:replicative DNA helicase
MTLNSLESYGINFQVKVIASLLTDKEFLNNVHDVLDEEHFSNQAHKWVLKEILSYYHKYHTTPTIEVLKIELKKLDNDVLKVSIKEQLKEAYEASTEAKDLEYVQKEFSKFCKNQNLKGALLSSVDLLKMGDYDSIRNLIDNALRSGQDKTIGHEYTKDVETRYRDEDRAPIPFPWPKFNEVTQGGYGKGDLVLIFGNPGGGKSWAIVDMAAHAASLGYNIVYYALELGESYVGKRFDANLTKIPVDKLSDNRDKVEEVINSLPGTIIIKEYSPRRASLDTIEQHLKKLKSLYDFTPDAIFIDYLDLLKTRKPRKERKDEIDDVFTDAKGLAKELKIPIISPSQINRAGAKDDVLEADKIAGSYDKIMIGDISLSLSRKRKDKLNGTGRWHFMKNRFGPDGMTFSSKIDTSIGKIEIMDNISEEMEMMESQKTNNSSGYGDVDEDEKYALRKKFFELEGKTI